MIERIDRDAAALGGFFSTFAVHILGNLIIRMHNVSVSTWRANRKAYTDTYGFIEERLAGREDIRTDGAPTHGTI